MGCWLKIVILFSTGWPFFCQRFSPKLFYSFQTRILMKVFRWLLYFSTNQTIILQLITSIHNTTAFILFVRLKLTGRFPFVTQKFNALMASLLLPSPFNQYFPGGWSFLGFLGDFYQFPKFFLSLQRTVTTTHFSCCVNVLLGIKTSDVRTVRLRVCSI